MKASVRHIHPYNIANYNKTIVQLYRDLPTINAMDIAQRVQNISTIFLGCPYLLDAAGEGYQGRFDQSPLYRFDRFDCVTYINNILALALSHDVISFRKNLIRIGYRDARLDYSCRHHFMSVDWNSNNQAMGLVKDITSEIVNDHGKPIFQQAEALIDRPRWFQHRSFNDICLLQKISANKAVLLLNEMRAIADQVEPQQSHLPYLPLSDLFDSSGNAKENIFLQIPQAAVVEIVRPNWPLQNKIGTNLNVSHVGFAIWHENQLFYRQASSIKRRVVDIPMAEYLKQCLTSATIKGINVQQLKR